MITLPTFRDVGTSLGLEVMRGHALAAVDDESLELIVAQARNGSREAFDALIRRFEKNVMKTALYLTRNLDDAQDVAQEVYIRIFRFLEHYRETAKIESWVYRITVNAARDFQRRKRFWLPLENIFQMSEEKCQGTGLITVVTAKVLN